MNGLLGLLNFGARYAESPSEPLSMKGKGYFGLLPASDGESTEISVTDEQGRSFPSLVPTLTQDEINYLMQGNDPTDEIYRKAQMWADYRQSMGMSPFASPTELRIPTGLLGR